MSNLHTEVTDEHTIDVIIEALLESPSNFDLQGIFDDVFTIAKNSKRLLNLDEVAEVVERHRKPH